MTQKSPSRSSRTASSAKTSQPEAGFSYHRDFFEDLVDTALGHAKKLGATDAAAEASEGCGLSVSVRKGELESVERNRDKSLGITVYVGKKRGNASTSDFSKAAIKQTVQAAYDIARFTAEDETSGLPDEQDIARDYPALDLFHPWAVTSEDAARLALHLAEQWRDKLIASDEVLAQWMTDYPDTDSQQLRALIRQARKDIAKPETPGEAPRHGKSYREIFQLVRQAMKQEPQA